mgnify:CR=1 FL=1
MRDGAQQIGAQLLVFSEHRRFLTGLHGAGAIERQLAFARDGIGKRPLLGRQRIGLGDNGEHPHHRGGIARAHHGVTRAHSQVYAIERRSAIGGIERRSHIGGRESRGGICGASWCTGAASPTAVYVVRGSRSSLSASALYHTTGQSERRASCVAIA